MTDIHGCCQTFRYMTEQVIYLQKNDKLFLLGDYIDRGPDSKGVIDYILQLIEAGFDVTCLRGNHEQMMLNSLTDPSRYSIWFANGGDTTLRSFEAKNLHEIDELYYNFLNSLDYYRLLGDYWLAHAGFNFNAEDIFEDTHSMLWIRHWYSQIDTQLLENNVIVHGHTPMERNKITQNLAQFEYPVIDIDAGCVFGGHLCAMDLDNRSLFFHKNIDRP